MDIKRQSPGCLPPVAHLLIPHFTVCPSSSCWILVVDSQFAITCSGDPYRPCAFASNKIRKGFASNKERKQITSTPWTLPRNTVNNNLSLSLSLSISLSLSLSRARAHALCLCTLSLPQSLLRGDLGRGTARCQAGSSAVLCGLFHCLVAS